tara:strand:- start:1001 stop:1462 length:462 start_codon:yes stop_codon:yes gene_type:complete
MAHYAFIDSDNIVVEVITGKNEDDTSVLPEGETWEDHYGSFREGLTCLRTSYNTHRNVHLSGGTPFRGNYAGIGMSYDSKNDMFLHPKPYESWVLDVATAGWKPPIDYPSDANQDLDTSAPVKNYDWDESSESWTLSGVFNYNDETGEWELEE